MCLFLLGIFFFSLKKTKQQLVLYIIKIRKPSLTLHLMESMLAWNEGFLFLHSVCIIFQASDILYLQHCSFLFVMRASLRWKMLCPQPVTLKCPNARPLNIFREKKPFLAVVLTACMWSLIYHIQTTVMLAQDMS